MGPIGSNSSQHMVCFLLYACLAVSEYQTSHSSQLLALMKDLFALGDKDGTTDSWCFSRSEEQTSLPHPLSGLVVSRPHYHCPTSDLTLSCQDGSLASKRPSCLSFSPLCSKITLPEGSSSSTEIFQWLLLAPMWNPSFLAC